MGQLGDLLYCIFMPPLLIGVVLYSLIEKLITVVLSCRAALPAPGAPSPASGRARGASQPSSSKTSVLLSSRTEKPYRDMSPGSSSLDE